MYIQSIRKDRGFGIFYLSQDTRTRLPRQNALEPSFLSYSEPSEAGTGPESAVPIR